MKLRELRIRKVWTQAALAAKAGISISTVAAIEQGKQQPSLATGQKLAKVLGVEPTAIEEVRKAVESQLGKPLWPSVPSIEEIIRQAQGRGTSQR